MLINGIVTIHTDPTTLQKNGLVDHESNFNLVLSQH